METEYSIRHLAKNIVFLFQCPDIYKCLPTRTQESNKFLESCHSTLLAKDILPFINHEEIQRENRKIYLSIELFSIKMNSVEKSNKTSYIKQKRRKGGRGFFL